MHVVIDLGVGVSVPSFENCGLQLMTTKESAYQDRGRFLLLSEEELRLFPRPSGARSLGVYTRSCSPPSRPVHGSCAARMTTSIRQLPRPAMRLPSAAVSSFVFRIRILRVVFSVELSNLAWKFVSSLSAGLPPSLDGLRWFQGLEAVGPDAQLLKSTRKSESAVSVLSWVVVLVFDFEFFFVIGIIGANFYLWHNR